LALERGDLLAGTGTRMVEYRPGCATSAIAVGEINRVNDGLAVKLLPPALV
jgi:hypothetical protein